MSFWQKTALGAALVGAVGYGAAVAPAVSGQSRVRVVEPADVQVFSFGGGRLGVTISDIDTADSKVASGVRIDEVEEGSPAEKAGFQKGDVVTEFDGERVRSEAVDDEGTPGVKWSGRWMIPRPTAGAHLVLVAEGPDPRRPFWPIAPPYQRTSPEVAPRVIGVSGTVRVGSRSMEAATRD